jgi:ABC-type transport system involved in multi-copper enzyme maturation permease subunit
MPIHDQGYRRYGGRREPSGRTWAVIARNGILNMVRQRKFLGLLLLAWLPFVVHAVQFYIAANFPQASMLAATPKTFRDFFEWQTLFVFIVTIYAGAGLIANDRRANALQIYLSKPMTRVEYIIGKLAVLVVFLVGVTWLPAMLLLILQIMFAGSVTFIRNNLFLFPAITLFAVIQVFTAAFAMLALSSMSKSSRFVGIMYAGLIFFTAALYNAVRAITGSSAFAWLSPSDCLDIVANAIFRTPSGYTVPVWVAFASILALIGASIAILERRVRGVEVVT